MYCNRVRRCPAVFSGCSQVPVTGFPTQAVLSFDKNSSLPSASTCSIELFIPLKFSSLDDFKTHMNEALQHQVQCLILMPFVLVPIVWVQACLSLHVVSYIGDTIACS